jgi:hypothetical protein
LPSRTRERIRSIREACQTHGIGGVLRLLERWILIALSLRFHRPFRSCTRFSLENRSYRYFYHWYNATYENERTVEVPIIWQFVKSHRGKMVLEAGNVLSHYYAVDHDIVDKYEVGRRVINEDLVAFKREDKRYDLVISISTLEHLGWDETPRDPLKPLIAIRNLTELLSPGGIIAITIPIGYNPHLDTLIRENRVRFNRRICLKRISGDNLWRQVDWEEIRYAKYNSPFPFANGLVIGVIQD